MIHHQGNICFLLFSLDSVSFQWTVNEDSGTVDENVNIAAEKNNAISYFHEI